LIWEHPAPRKKRLTMSESLKLKTVAGVAKKGE
jgi:hypothetical protein